MKKLLLVLAIIIVFTACNQLYNEHKSLPNMSWERQNKLTFGVDIPEAKEYTLKINLRHTSHIQIGEIPVKLTLSHGNQVDEIENQAFIIPIRDKATGELVGSAMGDICDTEYPIKFAFKQKGKYNFTLEHEMEDDKVEAIMEVGINIEK